MSLQQHFESAARQVRSLPSRPSQADLLNLYGLYKQATEGNARDSSAPAPGLLDFKGKQKRQAWMAREGTSTDEAMDDYIRLVRRLQAGR